MSVSSSDDCSVDGAAASSSSPSAAAPGRHPSSSSAPTPAPGLGPAGCKAPPPQPSGQPGRAAAAPLSPCEVVHDVVKKRVADADRADGWLSPLCAVLGGDPAGPSRRDVRQQRVRSHGLGRLGRTATRRPIRIRASLFAPDYGPSAAIVWRAGQTVSDEAFWPLQESRADRGKRMQCAAQETGEGRT